MEDQINSEITRINAGGVWRTHQADRAWIEWGICWPPLSVSCPRCQTCSAAWPCALALGAHACLTDAGSSTVMPTRWPETFRS